LKIAYLLLHFSWPFPIENAEHIVYPKDDDISRLPSQVDSMKSGASDSGRETPGRKLGVRKKRVEM
jgi:hypothetical protein